MVSSAGKIYILVHNNQYIEHLDGVFRDSNFTYQGVWDDTIRVNRFGEEKP